MKKTFTLLLLSIFSLFLTAQNAQVELISSTIDESVFKVTLDGFSEKAVETPNGEQFIIQLENGTPILKAGAPDLPKLTASLVIDDTRKTRVKATVLSYTDYENMEVAPSKGNVYRDVDISQVPYQYGEEYNQDQFYPAENTFLRAPYIMRDFRGQAVVLQPVQYNPVSKVLRVVNEMKIKVSTTQEAGENQLIRTKSFQTVDDEFNRIYQRHFLNYEVANAKYNPVPEQGNMLIITDGNFMDELEPFIDWKKRRGIPVEIEDVANIGDENAIETYVENYYNNNGLTFLLLVGDAAQVPTLMSPSGHSDNSYAYINGNDSYPEFFVGRFSAETEDHVETMVERTLRYERYPQSGAAWYSTGVGIASDEGPGDDGERDCEHVRNIRTDLLNFTYQTVHELYDGSQGGADAPGDPNPSDLFNILENGVSIMNYTGHGSNNSCATTGLNSGDVDNLTNVDIYPFFFSVACVNGNFVNITCFAETWLRATDNTTGEPTGAIATLMSTINQSWSPPMCGQDEMNDILAEVHANNVKRTFGAISMNGCMQMNDEYGGAGDQMTDTWTVFGDPSFVVRTAAPVNMNVIHVVNENVGVDELSVFCLNHPGATVSLMNDGEIIGTGIIDQNGAAVIPFDPILQPDTIEVNVTAFNATPYLGEVHVSSTVGEVTSQLENQLDIFPNPTNGLTQLSFTTDKDAQYQLEVFDITGQLVFVRSMDLLAGDQRIDINTQNWGIGVYHIKLTSDENSIARKLVVK